LLPTLPARRSFSIGGSFKPSAFSLELLALLARRRLNYTVGRLAGRRLSYTLGGLARRSFSVGGSLQLSAFLSACLFSLSAMIYLQSANRFVSRQGFLPDPFYIGDPTRFYYFTLSNAPKCIY
jgi:hypothetical protein